MLHDSEGHTVTAVIPTIGRRELKRAVASALEQSFPVSEVIVSVDGSPGTLGAGILPNNRRVKVIYKADGDPGGGNAARARAIASAKTDVVALLDDDDWWAPDKISRQMRLYRACIEQGHKHVVIACRSIEHGPDGEQELVPRILLREGQSVADYLFVRRQLVPGAAALGSSMLLCTRELFDVVALRCGIPRHQDWDWLLRVNATPAMIAMLPDALVHYTRQQTAQSVSASPDWRASLEWCELQGDRLSPRQRADFLLCVPGALAARARDYRGLWSIVSLAAHSDGSWRAWTVLSLEFLLPSNIRIGIRRSITSLRKYFFVRTTAREGALDEG